MRTTKISIAIDKKKLQAARLAAKSAGVSLSAFLGRGLDLQLDAHQRLDAARALAVSWGADSTPTPEERAELRKRMSRPRRQGFRAARGPG